MGYKRNVLDKCITSMVLMVANQLLALIVQVPQTISGCHYSSIKKEHCCCVPTNYEVRVDRKEE